MGFQYLVRGQGTFSLQNQVYNLLQDNVSDVGGKIQPTFCLFVDGLFLFDVISFSDFKDKIVINYFLKDEPNHQKLDNGWRQCNIVFYRMKFEVF